MKAIRTPEELADYLIDNSNAFDRDEKAISLAKAAQEDLVTVGKKNAHQGVRGISRASHLKEIASVLRIFCPHTEEVSASCPTPAYWIRSSTPTLKLRERK